MNWLGKVFVVVILIMSLVFMGLAMAVYATHKNWKQVSDDLNKKLTDAQSREREAADRAQSPRRRSRTRKDHRRAASCEVGSRASLAGRTKHPDSNRARRSAAESARTHRGRRVDAEDQRRAGHRSNRVAHANSQRRCRTAIKLFKTALDATEELHQAAGEYNSDPRAQRAAHQAGRWQ